MLPRDHFPSATVFQVVAAAVVGAVDSAVAVRCQSDGGVKTFVRDSSGQSPENGPCDAIYERKWITISKIMSDAILCDVIVIITRRPLKVNII